MKIIRDHQIPSEICDLIENAKKYVVMVTPYVDLWTRLTDSIEVARNKNVFIQLHYRTKNGKSEVKEKTLKDLIGLGVNVNGIELLHSKLYLSEYSAIMTSMNLYQHSSEKSKEIGFWTNKGTLLREYKTYIESNLTNKPILPKKTLFDIGKNHLKDLLATQEIAKGSAPTPMIEKKDFEKPEEIISDKINSKLLTTKELSELTGKSSRKINNWFKDNKLMYKKDGDWITTKKGEGIGGIVKDGQWGKFVIWPKEVAENIE